MLCVPAIVILRVCLLPEQHQPAPAIDGVFGKDWCMDLWREEKLPSQRREPVGAAATTSMGAPVGELFTILVSFLSCSELTDCCVHTCLSLFLLVGNQYDGQRTRSNICQGGDI